MKRQNIRTLSLIVCTITYLLIGACVFDALESENELRLRQQVHRVRSRLVEKYNISDNDYTVLESIIVKAIPHRAGHQWKFMGALYYSMTVISTIGYGHSTPMTMGGKAFTMLYAISGIPLGLIMFQSIGERLNTLSAKVLRTCKRCLGKRPIVNHIDLIITCTGLSTCLIAGGAFVFHKYEGWTYFDSLYYCFTTLTTIGFGDFVALQKDGALETRPEYVTFSLIFIVLGLVLVGAAMNLLVLRFLTLNTEDEKRDQREAKLAERGLVRIGSLNGRRQYSSRSESEERTGIIEELATIPVEAETISVCSCSCYELPYNDGTEPLMEKRYSVKSKSGKEIRSVDDLESGQTSTRRRKKKTEQQSSNEQENPESSRRQSQKLHRQGKIFEDYPTLLSEASSSFNDLQNPCNPADEGQTTADDLLRHKPSKL